MNLPESFIGFGFGIAASLIIYFFSSQNNRNDDTSEYENPDDTKINDFKKIIIQPLISEKHIRSYYSRNIEHYSNIEPRVSEHKIYDARFEHERAMDIFI